MDLTTTVSAVLVLGWLFQNSANEYALRNVLITQNEIYVAISRFTPQNLLLSYIYAAQHAVHGLVLANVPGAALSSTLFEGMKISAEMAFNVALAVPRTLIELYLETSGAAAWIVLVGFTLAAVTVVTSMLATGASVWRLLVAAAVSPLAISLVFLMLQGFMVLMLHAFFWFTSLAPYTVACPVLCTLYWVAFPNAERGATASVARAVLGLLEPQV